MGGGLGILTKASEVQASIAPTTSSMSTTGMVSVVMANAPSAGPAMLQAELIIWLIPAIRSNWDSGAEQRNRRLHGGGMEGRTYRP